MGSGAVIADAGGMPTVTASIRRAQRLAEATPASRNRYVDFLRAVSIVAVVIGHWLIAAPYAAGGELRGVNMLAHTPWTQWLTWIFQVMPVFFAVGGYANAASWNASRRAGHSYGTWLAARLRRLTIPLLPLLAVWAVIGIGGAALGIDEDLMRLGSQSALIPVWFLAVYVVIVAMSPWLIEAWDRYAWRSFLAPAGATFIVDRAVAGGLELLGWVNFILVWSAIHQLGVAWRRGALPAAPARIVAVGSALIAALLVTIGPYPVAMVGVPGAEASNNAPPTLALIVFGTMQMAALLAVEPAAQRMLQRPAAWTGTILVNGWIMTLYLWHLTAMVLAIGAMLLVGGIGLGIEPSSVGWWLTRPLWVVGLLAVTLPFLVLFGRFERPRPAPEASPHPLVALGAVAAVSAGLGLLAAQGVQGSFFGVRLEALALPAGAVLGLIWAGRTRRASEDASTSSERAAAHG